MCDFDSEFCWCFIMDLLVQHKRQDVHMINKRWRAIETNWIAHELVTKVGECVLQLEIEKGKGRWPKVGKRRVPWLFFFFWARGLVLNSKAWIRQFKNLGPLGARELCSPFEGRITPVIYGTHMSTPPAVIVWKMVDQHLFLNILLNNFITGTGQNRWWDWGMNVHEYLFL